MDPWNKAAYILFLKYRDINLRDIFECVPQLNAQILDVPPLAFLHRLAC